MMWCYKTIWHILEIFLPIFSNLFFSYFLFCFINGFTYIGREMLKFVIISSAKFPVKDCFSYFAHTCQLSPGTFQIHI